MKVKKIQNKLEFDVEAQGNDCLHDCYHQGSTELIWTGETWAAIFQYPELRGLCISTPVSSAYWSAHKNPLW